MIVCSEATVLEDAWGCMQDDIKDRIGLLEQRGRLLLKLPEEREAAEDVYRQASPGLGVLSHCCAIWRLQLVLC